MELLAKHKILATGDTCDDCKDQVVNFFQRTSLVRYDKIKIDEACLCATDAQFATTLAAAMARNREILANFVEELGNSGFEHRHELTSISQGYESKVLHIIAHFVDGFIGIDSAFYSLVDDSHWLPDETKRRIEEEPGRFWLFSLECYSVSPGEAALLHQ